MLDETDRAILEALKENSRTPYLRIAKELGISEGTVRKRVKSMKENGTILKFSTELSSKLQFDTVICIKCDPKKTQEIIEKISKTRGNKSFIFEVTGPFDIIMHAQMQNAEDMNNLIDDIGKLQGVKETESFTVMKKH